MKLNEILSKIEKGEDFIRNRCSPLSYTSDEIDKIINTSNKIIFERAKIIKIEDIEKPIGEGKTFKNKLKTYEKLVKTLIKALG